MFVRQVSSDAAATVAAVAVAAANTALGNLLIKS